MSDFLNRLSIRTKMAIGILGAIAFITFANMTSQYIFNQTHKTFEQIVEIEQKKLSLVGDLGVLSAQRAVLQRDMLILEEEDETRIAQTKEALTATATGIFETFEALNLIEMSSEETQIYDQLRTNVSSANQLFAEFMLALEDGFKDEAAQILWNDFLPKYNAFVDLTAQLKLSVEAAIKSSQVSVEVQQNQGVYILWGLLALSVVVFTVGGFIISVAFLKPIDELKDTMKQIVESGDLSVRVPETSKDELGITAKDVNLLLCTISEAINEVNSVMTQIASGRFESRIERPFKGDFLELKNGVNESASQVFNMVILLRSTAHGLKTGKLNALKTDYIDLKGDYANVIQDIDEAMRIMTATVLDISETLKSLSKGEFDKRVTAEAYGEFVDLKDAINATLDSLESFVEDVSKTQSKMKEGDLRQLVTGDYQGKMGALKENLNSSSANISSMIGKVGAVTKMVARDSDQIAHGSQEISSRIQVQTDALEKTNQRMTQMTESVQNNAESAQTANDMVQSAGQQLNQGVEVMGQALASMAQMSDASQKINDIVVMIDSIAFQTNLLALNAAVEAARAGEHGRGFAVVAGEVRSLAGKSAEAASEIKGLIENSVRTSEESGQYVKQVSEVLGDLDDTMAKVSNMVSTISNASTEQSKGIADVSMAVSQMQDSTQENSALVEESASSSNDLRYQAEELLRLVDSFKVSETEDSHTIARLEHN